MKKLLTLLVAVFYLNTNAQIITTVAGTGTAAFSGDNGQATLAKLSLPKGVVFDVAGNMYIVDENNSRIRMVNTAGVITTIAGTGAFAFSGDNGPATAAALYTPTGMTIDALGNLIIVDEDNMCIRKINTAGTITTIVGSGGNAGFTGDGGQATAATLTRPYAAEYDAAGNLYIADTQNNRIRKVSTSGVITTIAGNGTGAFAGDNGPATAAELNGPNALAFDAAGNLYIADAVNARIRMINTAGTISTYAGTGVAGYSADGIAATASKLNNPCGVVFDAQGNLYIGDANNNRIRKVTTSTGIISTIVGTGAAGYTGDGGLATAAKIQAPVGMAFDANGSLYFADALNNCIRKVTSPCPVVINGTTSLCSNNNTILTASGATSYTWSANAGSVSTSTISVSPTSNTTYTVTSAGAGCTGTNTITVTVTTSPTLSISGDTTICSGDNTTLTANGATSYTWTSSAFSVATQSINISPNNDATFTVTAANGNCTDTKIGTVHVTQTPTIDVNGIVNVCTGNNTILTANGATTYTWSANANSVNTNTVSVNPTTNTTYTVTGANGTCAVTKTVSVNVTTTPTLSISGDTTLCSGDNTTLTANGATSYVWATSTFSVATQSINTTPTNNITYTVTASNGNCIDVKTITIHVTPLPNPTISGLTNICSNGNGTVLTASGPYTFTWSANAGNVNTNSVSVNPVSNTTYSLVSSDGTCFGNDTISVTVTTTPTLSINGNTSICSGTSTTLTASGATSYTWSSGTSSIVTQTVNASPNNTITYTVVAANGNCTDMGTVTVSVTPTPIIDVNGTTNICSGANGTLLTASGATTYTWSANAASATTNTISVNPINNTTYTVTGSNGLCSTTDTVLVNVTTTPTVTINGATNLCSGTNTTFTANGATTYTWSANANNATTSTVTINATTANTYTVIGANGNCESNSTITINVTPLPIITSLSDTICTGQATLHASGASTYTWSPTPDFSNGSGSSVIYSPTLTTTYTITGTATTSCVGTTTVSVVINCNANGIASFSNTSAQINIYPNPAQNNFTVEVSTNEKQIISLFDVNGKQVLSQIISSTTNIDASNLATGVYNINITSSNGVANKKLVIIH